MKALKMEIRMFDCKYKHLLIADNAVMVLISRNGHGNWQVLWQFLGSELHRLIFSSAELAAAFGIIDDPGKTGMVILQQYGGDSAEDGKYLRWQQWLNIPSVPVNYEIDAAVSIEIDDYMRGCVKSLLED